MGVFPSKEERLLTSYVPVYLACFRQVIEEMYRNNPDATYLPTTIASAHHSSADGTRRTLGLTFETGERLAGKAYQVCLRQVVPEPYVQEYAGKPPPTMEEARRLVAVMPRPQARPDLYLPRYRERFIERLSDLNAAIPEIAYGPALVREAHWDARVGADAAARIHDAAHSHQLALDAYQVCVSEVIPEPHRARYVGKPPPDPT
jgi:hypothetical protein